ncbi:TrmB family transcriptional regulator [Halobacteriaceae archaeon SHR40]|uniref:TrmB family transcriptional regulator n=1 Tax=Halovenus amylolytica TaxID=2500550 RepID=UPI000FE3937A
MDAPTDPDDLLQRLDLTEYQRTALAFLFESGRTTAPDISDGTGIPQARIYGVLDSLANLGFIKVIPGRPKKYQPKSPEQVLKRAMENRRQEYEDYRSDVAELRESFIDTFGPMYERADEDLTPTAELFHVVDVGEPSETETRRLYHDANTAVYVITNSFAYFGDVEPAVADALDRGVEISVLFLDPTHLPAEKAAVQEAVVERLSDEYPSIEFRFSEEVLPWRGTFVDPSMDYDSGEAIFLVEEPEVPDHKRKAALTGNGSFVAGMKRYFDLVWEFDSSL